MSSIDFSWPSEIAVIINSQQTISDAPASVLSFDCLLMDLAFGKNPSVRLNYVKIIMYAFLPFIIVIVSWAYWRIHSLFRKMESEERDDRINATSIIIAFLLYPYIVKVIAQSMNCTPIDD